MTEIICEKRDLTQKEKWDIDDSKFFFFEGRANRIHFYDEDWFEMRLNGNLIAFEVDETAKTVAQYLNKPSNVKIEYYSNRYDGKKYILSANVNGFYIQNQSVANYRAEQEQRKQIRRQHHNLLFPFTNFYSYLIVLVKSDESTLVGLGGSHSFLSCRQDGQSVLLDHLNIAKEDVVGTKIREGCLISVKNHPDYQIGIFKISTKRKSCGWCGTGLYENERHNHGIVVGADSFHESRYCEYCFFEHMNIVVPENFKCKEVPLNASL